MPGQVAGLVPPFPGSHFRKLVTLRRISLQDDVSGTRTGYPMTNIAMYVFLGVIAGALSGLVGIGGGVIIVPALVLLFGFSQHDAQGTTLALLVPPIGILGAWTYYQHGHVNIQIAALICAGFFSGSRIGARVATDLSNVVLERVVGFGLLLIGLKMLWAR